MGFVEKWAHPIMICIATVTYLFIINGDPVGYVMSKRGIKQGDPPSPYLFVLYVEGLSTLFTAREKKGQLKGVTICKGAPSVNHLLFVDDSYIFAQNSLQECQRVKVLFKIYENALGQAINHEKSYVAFSLNLTKTDVQLLVDCLGVSRVAYHDRYVGLPVFMGKAKKATLVYIKDRLWKKLNGLWGNLLSSAGKELLIKIVAQVLYFKPFLMHFIN